MTTKINSLNIDLEQPYLYKGEILKINLGVLSYKHIVIYITNILELLNNTFFAGNALLENKSEMVAQSTGLNIFGIIARLL